MNTDREDSYQCQWARDGTPHDQPLTPHSIRVVPGSNGFMQMCPKHAECWGVLLERWIFHYSPEYAAMLLKLLNTKEDDYPIA